MEIVEPGKVAHGGTYSSNPVSMAAALETLHQLDYNDIHDRLHKFGAKLRQGIHEVLIDNHIPHVVQGHPTMFQFLATRKDKIHDYRDLASCDLSWYSKLHLELMKRGVMFDEDNQEVIFTCAAHKTEDREKTLRALDGALKALKQKPKI